MVDDLPTDWSIQGSYLGWRICEADCKAHVRGAKNGMGMYKLQSKQVHKQLISSLVMDLAACKYNLM